MVLNLRAICLYDVETNKRIRCIRQGHKSRPNIISVLSARQIATGAETGEVYTIYCTIFKLKF